MRILLSLTFIAVALALVTSVDAGQDKKKRTGTVVGEIKSSKKTPNGKNQIIDVQAAGEQKARQYRVQYDPKAKGPIAEILEAVRAAKVGDRVELEWIDTGEGLAITAFQVRKKGPKSDEPKKNDK